MSPTICEIWKVLVLIFLCFFFPSFHLCFSSFYLSSFLHSFIRFISYPRPCFLPYMPTSLCFFLPCFSRSLFPLYFSSLFHSLFSYLLPLFLFLLFLPSFCPSFFSFLIFFFRKIAFHPYYFSYILPSHFLSLALLPSIFLSFSLSYLSNQVELIVPMSAWFRPSTVQPLESGHETLDVVNNIIYKMDSHSKNPIRLARKSYSSSL